MNDKRVLGRFFLVLSCIGFLAGLTLTTEWMYNRGKDHRVLIPERIVEGTSQAPNQYRVLAPLTHAAVKTLLFEDSKDADRFTVGLSVFLCYLAAGALFFRLTKSLPMAMIGQLAVFGAFAFGIAWKYRQEYFETAFVAAALLTALTVRRCVLMYLALFVITVLGSLNRETFSFCLLGIAVHLLWEQKKESKDFKELIKRFLPHLGYLAVLGLTFIAIYVGTRWYYGLSEYHCKFWMYDKNMVNVTKWMSPYNLFYIGAGVVFAFFASLSLGNRNLAPFLISYSIPLFGIGFFITNFAEHRVFYPLMMLMVASMLTFAVDRIRAEEAS